MPRCEGLPNGPCPKKINNRTVKNSIADLLLCPSCEASRFSSVDSSVDKRSANTDTKQIDVGDCKTSATTATGSSESATAAITTDNSYCSDDGYEHSSCYSCQENITSNELHIICSICCNKYHQQCSGLPHDVFCVLLNIVKQAGWVCHKCRLDFNGVKVNLAKVHEELADMRASIGVLFNELKGLKDVNATKRDTETVRSTNMEVTANGNTSTLMDKSEVQLEVYRTINDATKRKCNVIITGLPEATNSSPEEDCHAFTEFCEEHLPVKPVLSHKGCRRLGKRTDQRPRRLLVHLTSETSANSLITASKDLRSNEVTKNIYINPDLSKIEAKLAFEQRERRRAARRSSLNVNSDVFHPGDITRTASVNNMPVYDNHFPSLNAVRRPSSDAITVQTPNPFH